MEVRSLYSTCQHCWREVVLDHNKRASRVCRNLGSVLCHGKWFVV